MSPKSSIFGYRWDRVSKQIERIAIDKFAGDHVVVDGKERRCRTQNDAILRTFKEAVDFAISYEQQFVNFATSQIEHLRDGIDMAEEKIREFRCMREK